MKEELTTEIPLAERNSKAQTKRSENMGPFEKVQIVCMTALMHTCGGAVRSQILDDSRWQAKHFRQFSDAGYGKLSKDFKQVNTQISAF